jgi:hypothetical protein
MGGRRSLTKNGGLMISASPKERACDDVGLALNTGNIGDIVAKHEKLIVKYYEDVQGQAERSFALARSTARIGFGVLIFTIIYIFVFDALHRFDIGAYAVDVTASVIGLVSGALIEFTAGVTFWLYSRTARQFGAFHICLERTHRYLLAYKMVEQLGTNKDQTLHDLICIMANAPMISQELLDGVNPPRNVDTSGRKDDNLPV